jgi:pimeloyl-ACP methyl ester carboxylesterase
MIDFDDGKFLALDVGGEQIKVHYYELGEKDEEPVIFVQTGGAATSAYMCWYLNFEAFTHAGYHVLAPDSVGFGLTARVSPTSEKGGISAPKFLLAFMDAIGVEQAHFVGNSAGAMTITRLGIGHPERVKSLILTGGEPRIETNESRAIAKTLGQTDRMNFVRTMLSKPHVSFQEMRKATADFFYDPGHPRIDEVTEMRLRIINRPGMVEAEREHAFKQVERGRSNLESSDLAKIRSPVYLIHGRDERFFYSPGVAPILLECAIKASFVMPNCSCTVLAHCGHWPQIEKADLFNVHCLEFLRGV